MRRLGGQRGQTAVEYLGVLLVVGVVIATIAASGIAATVSDAIGRQICRVASDGPCEQSVASGTDGRSDGGERLPGPGRSAGSGAPSVDQGQAQVAGRARGRALTLRPAVARQGAQTCFATTSMDCRPPGGAYELAPREPTPGEQIDGLLSEAGDSTEAWLGWLSGSDPSSPFYDPLAQDEREGQLEALDDGLAFLEDLNRAPSPLGSTGPLGDSGGDLGNELLGISDLRRAIDASQRGDSLQALGFFGLAWPFSKPGKAIQEGLEETTEQTGRQATREGAQQATKAGQGGAGPVRLGQAGEDAVRGAYDIGDKVPIRVAGRGRIPDGLTPTTLSEVKNVGSLSYTRQLRDFEQYAQQTGRTFNLFVRPGARLSRPLLDARAAGRIKIREIP